MRVGRLRVEENQFSDISFWLQRDWDYWAKQPQYGMDYWLSLRS
jgi:hypothetical protein